MAWVLHQEATRETGTRCQEHDRYCKFKAGHRDPQKRVRYKTFKTKRDAESYLARMKTDVVEDTYRDPKLARKPFGEILETVVEAPHLSPATRARYRTHAALYLTPAFGHRGVGNITVEEIKRFIADLSRRKGAETVRSVYTLLRRVLSVAVDNGYMERNRAAKVDLPHPEGYKARFLTEPEVEAIADAVPQHYSALVRFLAYSGLRIGEASALKVKHLDLTHGMVHVEENSSEVAGHKITGPTKSRKRRTVYLMPRHVEMLARHLETRGTPKDPESLVFTGQRGAAIRQNAFRKRIFQPAAEKVGIHPTPHVHDLRHTAASLFALWGWSQYEAAQMLGHSDLEMTRRYGHLYSDEMQAKAKRLDASWPVPREADVVKLVR